jgi:1-acyl-sn-glycerol-3-phosphate acyltransferase
MLPATDITGIYRFCRAAVILLARTAWGMRVVGAENVPLHGPLIVACNHVAYLDPPLLGAAAPRRISYMAKIELFRIPVLGPLIRALGAFPVDRSKGDVGAIRVSVRTLREGVAVGIFPEGGRNPDGRNQPKTGAALLAQLSGAPVVPAYVSGTSGARFRHPITVAFGKPLYFVKDGQKAPREALSKWTDELMREIAALRESTCGN